MPTDAERAIEMIGDMCKEGRPPKMTIPVRDTDEDLFITKTIEALVERIAELEDGTPRAECPNKHTVPPAKATWPNDARDMVPLICLCPCHPENR